MRVSILLNYNKYLLESNSGVSINQNLSQILTSNANSPAEKFQNEKAVQKFILITVSINFFLVFAY